MLGPVDNVGMKPTQGNGPTIQASEHVANRSAGLSGSKPLDKALSSTSNLSLRTGIKRWSSLNKDQRLGFVLGNSLDYVLRPLSLLSCLSSVSVFIMSRFFKRESKLLDKVAEWSNRGAYLLNGLHQGVDNADIKNLPGAIGYSLVSLSSILGSNETMYFLKGWGSLLDQLPGMLKSVGHNLGVQEYFKGKGKKVTGENFYECKSFWESIEKTFVSGFIVCKDIVRELIQKRQLNIFKPLYEVFVKSPRRAERNLITSSLGILAGVTLGTFFGFKKLGPSLRDIFGVHADLAVMSIGFAEGERKKETKAGNASYMTGGIFYTLGSIIDFIYRWTKMEKLELVAVGFDNAGFLLHASGNYYHNRGMRDEKNGNGQIVKNKGAIAQPTLAPALP